MVKIKTRLRVGATRERVWEVVSGIDDDSYFWRGITSVRNLSRNGNAVTREVILGRDNVCIQVLTIHPVERIQTRWVSGVISGTRDILLFPLGQTTLLEIQMNYEFPGIGRHDSKRLAELFQAEAELAADLIKRRSEGFECDIPVAERLWMN
ncbi:MAG: SRPBCC family protein [Thaumarchaeota archaeon]|nr:SRPBCC family protein [Nitrososphaerota archaeon]